MFQVANPIWNQIARQPEMKSEQMKALFSLPPDAMNRALDKQAELLAKAGSQPRVINAYQVVAPLLLERPAIQAYLERTESSHLAKVLVDLESVAEALDLATTEYRLTNQERSALKTLLQRSPPLQTSSPPSNEQQTQLH